MVKLGILCEGPVEPIILHSQKFQKWLEDKGLFLVKVHFVGSKNQYWADRIDAHIKILQDLKVDNIIILVDMDKDACITNTKKMIKHPINCNIVVCVKEFENWYLADSLALSRLTRKDIKIDNPEEFDEPIKEIIRINRGRGFGGSKRNLATKMIDNDFSLENAAAHPNCPSARYFLNKLKQIAVN